MRRFGLAAAVWLLVPLLGCGTDQGAQKQAAPEGATAQPETVMVPIERAKETGNDPAPTAPIPEGSVTYTPLDSGAQADASGAPIVITGGRMEIAVTGNAAMVSDIRVEEGAGLRLVLQSGATFTGSIRSASMRDVAVLLDQTSVWTLTADTDVGAIIDADTSFSNVHSAGFALQYDSEHADNAYLGGAAKKLPGDGYLTPVI